MENLPCFSSFSQSYICSDIFADMMTQLIFLIGERDGILDMNSVGNKVMLYPCAAAKILQVEKQSVCIG